MPNNSQRRGGGDIPAVFATDSLEALLAERGRQRPVIYWFALLGCTAAIVSLPFVEVDVSVAGSGFIRPATERSDILAQASGFVTDAPAKDNSAVHKGDMLLRLESKGIDESLATNIQQTKQKEAELADVTKLLVNLNQPGAFDPSELSTAIYLKEYERFASEQADNDLKLAKTEREWNRAKTLVTQSLISAREVDDRRFEWDQTRAARELNIRHTLERWQSDAVQKQSELDTLRVERKKLLDQKGLYIIKAPRDGILLGFNVPAPGAYVQAGQKLGEISPSDKLVAELYVTPKDIGRLHESQRVNLQVDAYPYTEWGLLPGEIKQISHDFVISGQQAMFKTTVTLLRNFLELRTGARGEIRKGMSVRGRFFLAHVTVWQILCRNMDSWLNPTQAGVTGNA